jgi:anti-anti-sigma factor
MEVGTDEKGVIFFKGALTASNIEHVYSVLEGIFDESPRNITLDLSGVEEIDTLGLQLLVSIRKTFSSDGNVRILAVSPQVAEAVEISGFGIALRETMR